MQALVLENVTKTYGDRNAVDGISFSVPSGSFTAFLGPNGAGKSTTISMICSLQDPDSGSIRVLGKDSRDPGSRRGVGVVFQDSMLDPNLTVRENILIRGSMYGLEDLGSAVERALDASECSDLADSRYGELSGGQRRRADIARAMVHSPGLLILDEPTTGLDPQSRRSVWSSIHRLNAEQGTTVLLTTHYMEEAAGADDVIIIDHGRIAAHGTPEELKERYSRDRMTIVPKDMDAARGILGGSGIRFSEERGVLTVVLGSTAAAIPVIELLKDQIASFEVRTGTLDEAFVSLLGGDERWIPSSLSRTGTCSSTSGTGRASCSR